MNLLQMLLGSMTNTSTVNTVSKKTGVSSDLTSKLLIAAIPILITYMTKNAKSSKSGAQSLLGALGQHTNKNTMESQISDADEDDGNKIISHILGTDKKAVVSNLATETGLTNKQVNQTLSNIAPALLSGLSAATTQSAQNTTSSGLDMGSLLSMFTGGAAQPQQQTVSNNSGNLATSLLGSLLGGGQSAQVQQTVQPKASSGNSALNLLGSLLSTDTSASRANNNSASNGTELLGLLSALMK